MQDHVNIVFVGHVDAGKSTIAGSILVLTNTVDQRTVEKYKVEAIEKNRSSWYLAYLMDTSEEERDRGKTIEVGRAQFVTDKRRYTIWDAPGHSNYVPNMINGAYQADIAVLVISARKGEFESGFDGGQTKEHAILCKTLGIAKLIVLINKMDDVGWDQDLYNVLKNKLSIFLKSISYAQDIIYIPASGFLLENILDGVSKEKCPWYDGKSLVSTLDDIIVNRNTTAPVRISIIDTYNKAIFGKIECGIVNINDKLLVTPNNVPVCVKEMTINDVSVTSAAAGEVVSINFGESVVIQQGAMLCDVIQHMLVNNTIYAKMHIVNLLPHKPLFTSGYTAMLHVHTCVKYATIENLKNLTSKKPFAKKNDTVMVKIKLSDVVCYEMFGKNSHLGRVTLRDEGVTIAFGIIIQ